MSLSKRTAKETLKMFTDKGYMYILECNDKTYYVGSTLDVYKRLQEHQEGFGANYTRKRLPVKLLYFEEFPNIKQAFYQEKQVQGWSRKKKEALMKGELDLLPSLSKSKRYASFSFVLVNGFKKKVLN